METEKRPGSKLVRGDYYEPSQRNQRYDKTGDYVTHSGGTNHVRGEKIPGIRPRSIAHVAQSRVPTSRPNSRFETTPQAWKSQSPAQVLIEEAGRADAEDKIGIELEVKSVGDALVGAEVDRTDGVDEVEELELELELVLEAELERDDEVTEADEEVWRLVLEREFERDVAVEAVIRAVAVIMTLVCVVQIATPSAFVVVVIVLSTVMPSCL